MTVQDRTYIEKNRKELESHFSGIKTKEVEGDVKIQRRKSERHGAKDKASGEGKCPIEG